MTGIAIKLTPSPFFPKKLAACYEDMASKGWILKEKGLVFDHFRYGEPQDLVYQIEYMKIHGSLENTQRRRRLKGGWDEIADRGMVHVFVADRDKPHSDMPEDADLDREIASQLASETLKWLLAIFCATVIFALSLIPGRGGSIFHNIVTGTEIYSLLFSALAATVFISVRQIALILHRRSAVLSSKPEKKVKWQKGVALYNAVAAILLLIPAVFLVMTVSCEISHREGDLLPNAASAPMIALEELEDVHLITEEEGWVGSNNSYSFSKSILSPQQHSGFEQCAGKGDYRPYIYEYCYKLRSPELARRMLEKTAEKSTWTTQKSEYKELSHPGFDYVIASKYETLAIKGDVFVYMIYKGNLTSEQLLTAVAEKL